MKKSVVFEWFFPLFVAVFAFLTFGGICVVQGEANLGGFLNNACVGFYNFMNGILHFFGTVPVWIMVVSYLLGLALLLGMIVGSIACLSDTIDLLTGNMGVSSYETYKDYYEAKLDGDTIKIDRAYDIHTTGAGWLRRLMFLTYLIWCIPVFVFIAVKYRQWKANHTEDD